MLTKIFLLILDNSGPQLNCWSVDELIVFLERRKLCQEHRRCPRRGYEIQQMSDLFGSLTFAGSSFCDEHFITSLSRRWRVYSRGQQT